MEGIQPTLPINGYNDGFGGGSGIWLFAILALMSGGFGYNRYGNYADGRCATVEDLNNSTNFSRLENQVRGNAELTERKTDAISNGICSLGYEIANKFGETNALIIAENQKTRDLLQQNKIEALQSQISKLELNQAVAGVIRYPTMTTYSSGCCPFSQGNAF